MSSSSCPGQDEDDIQCDKKCLLAAADASKKRNLMAVGGHTDNAVDLCAEDNADAKRQCLGKGCFCNGQTITQLLLQRTNNFAGGRWTRGSRRTSGP